MQHCYLMHILNRECHFSCSEPLTLSYGALLYIATIYNSSLVSVWKSDDFKWNTQTRTHMHTHKTHAQLDHWIFIKYISCLSLFMLWACFLMVLPSFPGKTATKCLEGSDYTFLSSVSAAASTMPCLLDAINNYLVKWIASFGYTVTKYSITLRCHFYLR